ncbi:glycosyltransferase [Rhodoferax aquaticus]|uniref:Glycosyltransferase n=1 Tax=Rhodoferax aquaticus TaxID=2527691 RepID=A0A515ETS7_9BURK|nr:glycosyltransferase [Rhodoferax aquaticus]QDL56074.1 glycosyltransferase [Rhodoferax aquaticus]
MTKTLDLGCGARPQNPFNADEVFGIDIGTDFGAHVRSVDLAIEPIPFEDNSLDFVTAYDFLGYVPRVIYTPKRRNSFVELINEVYRVLKPGGYFLSSTPAYPHGEAFQDPTHVNIMTDQTLPLCFDDTTRAAARYGFNGAFRIETHEWRGPHIFAVMQKVNLEQLHAPVTDANRKVSVFIPIYNGEKFIAQTLDSVLAQTMVDFEVVCIDDQSTDGSLAVLQAYAQKDARIRVFQTPHNMGTAPRALNYGLQFMQGGYFVYSSQDDLFSTDWLEKTRARAIATGADAVIPDLVFYYPDEPSRNRTLSGLHGDRAVVLNNRNAVQYSLQWEIPGNALWNANLVKKFKFEEFGLNSDEFSVRVFFMNCNQVAFSEGCFYYRQDNPMAVTKRITYKTFDRPYTQFRLYQYLKENRFSQEYVHREAIKVVDLMKGMRQWLDHNAANMPPDEVSKAQERLQMTMDCLKNDAMFSAVI